MSYWTQYSHAEIMSLHGVETEVLDDDLEQIYNNSSFYDEELELGVCDFCLGRGCTYCLCIPF